MCVSLSTGSTPFERPDPNTGWMVTPPTYGVSSPRWTTAPISCSLTPSAAVIVKVVVPLILAGWDPAWVAILAATGVTIATFLLTEGARRQTVAAVLWSAGITSWRSTRGSGAPRGIFCGIGVCFDCLVTVNDRPNQRACLVPANPGDAIHTQEGTGHDELG